MPEEQNVQAEWWNKRLNVFLERVLKWKQLGSSNNDVLCDDLKRRVGLDSVFAYQRNSNSAQQVVLVEAKTSENMSNINRSKIEKWVHDLIPKLECVPNASEFHDKFSPETNAEFQTGLIALWVRDYHSYSHDDIERWLAQIHVPRRRVPMNICFISNQSILRYCGIHAEVERLEKSSGYSAVRYYLPVYGDLPPADGSCLPLEILLGKFVFCEARRNREAVRGTTSYNDNSYIVFYTGKIESQHDMHFVTLAIKNFQIVQSDEVAIYTLYDPIAIRNYTDDFRSEFQNTSCNFTFRKLDVPVDLPGWLNEDD